MEPSSSSHAPRFTLLQGVVTFVVLLVVGALVYPAVWSGGSGVRSKRVLCLSNMKRLATAQMIYASDHHEAIPPYYTFDGATAQRHLTAAIDPYLKWNPSFLCTESARWKSGSTNTKQEIDYEHFPLVLKQVGKDGLIKLDKVASPERVGWMHDPVIKSSKVQDGEEVETNHKTHLNSFTVMFFDGHVKYVPTLKGTGRDGMDTSGVWLK